MSRASRVLADRLRDEYATDGLPTSKLSDIFDTEPVPLPVFLYDSGYLGLARQGVRLSPIQTDFIRHFEQVYSPETYIALVEQLGTDWEPVRMCHTLIACWGKGAGKDAMARFSFARVADQLLNLRNPQNYYGLPETDEIQMLNVAVSASQAHVAFFRPLRNLLVRVPRFADQFRSNPPSDNAKSVQFKKNLELISGHSQAESQEGMNLIAAIADEIAAFDTESEKKGAAGRVSVGTADYIIDMLRSSASTRFPEHFKLGMISYPRYESDAIMQAVAEGNKNIEKYGEKSSFYVSGPYSTWEVNPRVSKESPEIMRAYEDDPDFAAAKYECKPPKASNRYLRSDAAIEQGFCRVEQPRIETDYYYGLPHSLPNVHVSPQEGWQTRFYLSPDLVPMEGALYCLHGDIALRQDKAGVAMSHVSQYRVNAYNETEDPKPVVVTDFITAFSADLSATPTPREIKISWYRQLIFELLSRGFTIARATFDGYQSADMIQELTQWGIHSEVVSLDRNTAVYDAFKDVLYDGRLNAPYDADTITELQQLSKVTDRKIDHLPNGSKDLADAVAGSVYGAVLTGGEEGPNPTQVDMEYANVLNMSPQVVDLSLPRSFADMRLERY